MSLPLQSAIHASSFIFFHISHLCFSLFLSFFLISLSCFVSLPLSLSPPLCVSLIFLCYLSFSLFLCMCVSSLCLFSLSLFSLCSVLSLSLSLSLYLSLSHITTCMRENQSIQLNKLISIISAGRGERDSAVFI